MSSDETFSRREQLPASPTAAEPTVSITFTDEFITMIDKLVEKMPAASGDGDETTRRRQAIARAVSTLSDFAGERLFVKRQGRMLEIEGLWR